LASKQRCPSLKSKKGQICMKKRERRRKKSKEHKLENETLAEKALERGIREGTIGK
jgi:hypothetical protein